MAIARKPRSQAAAVDVDALINKGGSSPAADGKQDDKKTQMLLRIPPALTARLEAALQARAVRLPRHTWVLEAIAEKLDKEGK